MKFDEAYEYLEGNEDVGNNLYLADKEKTTTERFINGLQILAKYSKNIPQGADHDIIYICDFSDEMDMPVEELEELYRLGFHLDVDGFWAKFALDVDGFWAKFA